MQHFQALADEISIGLNTFKAINLEQRAQELQEGSSRIQTMRQQWSQKDRRTVSQSSMEEGDIDLF